MRDNHRRSPVVTQDMIEALWDNDTSHRLRDAFRQAGYTSEGIASRYGEDVARVVRQRDVSALESYATTAAPLDILVRLFWLGSTMAADVAASAIAPISPAEAMSVGLLESAGDDAVRAGVQIHPYHQWWIVADWPSPVRPGRSRADCVLGIGPAALWLTDAIPRSEVATALDLGVGGGVQSLHLSAHAAAVTGTDLSPRALRFAATSAALNGLEWDLRQGDMLDPVAGERFDLVVSNPPYILGPGNTNLLYRDSGRPGDALAAELAASAPAILTPGGLMVFEANWAHVAGVDWTERVASWVPDSGCDAWIVQCGLLDAGDYVRMWHDPHQESAAHRQAWHDYFRAEKIVAVGSGFVAIRHSGRDVSGVRVTELPLAIEGTLGHHIEAWFERQEWLATNDLLHGRLRAEGVDLIQLARPGAGGWEPVGLRLAQASGLRLAVDVDPFTAGLVGESDGVTTLHERLMRAAAAHHVDPAELVEQTVPRIRRLVEDGFLLRR